MKKNYNNTDVKASSQNEKPESKARTIIASVLSILFLLFAMVCVVSVFTSRATGFPKLFGHSMLSVQSNSMEPDIKVGDLIIGKSVTKDNYADLKEGQIISFFMIEKESGEKIINTHKIIEVTKYGNGAVYYTTRGTNPDISVDTTETVAMTDVIAVYTGTKLNGMGKVLDFLQSPTGFGLCVLLPIAIFFLYYLIDFIKKFSAYKAEVAAEEAAAAAEAAAKAAKEAELSDEEKRRIAEEYLKQMQEKASERKEE